MFWFILIILILVFGGIIAPLHFSGYLRIDVDKWMKRFENALLIIAALCMLAIPIWYELWLIGYLNSMQ